MANRTLSVIVLVARVAAPLAGQEKEPPTKILQPVFVSPAFSGPVLLRPLPDGRVLVSDIGSRQLLTLDSSLREVRVLATAQDAIHASGVVPLMLAYRGDSSALMDRATLSMQIIDAEGKLVRTAAIPRPSDAFFVTNQQAGKASFDQSGNLIYRSSPRIVRPPGSGSPGVTPDSSALLRVNQSGGVDTVTFVHIPVPQTQTIVDASGREKTIVALNPLPLVDDWAVLSDGSVAVFRGKTFELEIFGRDGLIERRPIPFPWRRLSELEKSALIDSAKAKRTRTIASQAEQAKSRGLPPPAFEEATFVDTAELPDYFPAFELNTIVRDNQDRLWVPVLATAVAQTNILLIISRTGTATERIAVKKGYSVVGFADDGSAYLVGPANRSEPGVARGQVVSGVVIIRAIAR